MLDLPVVAKVFPALLLIVVTACSPSSPKGEAATEPAGAALAGRIEVGAQPCAAEVVDDRVFVTLQGDDAVAVVDARTGELRTTHDVGSSPCGVAWAGESLWVALLGSDSQVVQLDADTGEVGASVPTAGDVWDLQPGHGSVWAVDRGLPGVLRIDPESGEVTATIEVDGTPSGIVAAGESVWVAQQSAGTVTQINPAADQVIATLETAPRSTWFADGNDAIWVTAQGGETVRIDTVTGDVAGTADTPGLPLDAAFAAGAVWVPDRDGGVLYRVDPARDLVTSELALQRGIFVVEPVLDEVWVLDYSGTEILRVAPGAANAESAGQAPS